MRKVYLFVCTALLIITGCAPVPQPTPLPPTAAPPTSTVTATSTIIPTVTSTAAPTRTPTPAVRRVTPVDTASDSSLPEGVTWEGDTLLFSERGLKLRLSQQDWALLPEFTGKTDSFEGYTFGRSRALLNEKRQPFSPSIGVMFYLFEEETDLITFTALLRARLGKNFPAIESMFSGKPDEAKLKIPALVYYGHIDEAKTYSVYIIHTVRGKVGIQISFEIVDSVLDQARPEFFEIMESIEFVE